MAHHRDKKYQFLIQMIYKILQQSSLRALPASNGIAVLKSKFDLKSMLVNSRNKRNNLSHQRNYATFLPQKKTTDLGNYELRQINLNFLGQKNKPNP